MRWLEQVMKREGMPDLQIENLINPQDFQKLGMDYPEVKRFHEDPIYMDIVCDRRNIKSLTDLEDTSSLGTAAINTIDGRMETVALTAEKSIGGDVAVQGVRLYEIHAKKKHPASPESHGANTLLKKTPNVSSTLSIREVLSGVKDKNGDYYIDPATGMPTWDTGFWQNEKKGSIGWRDEKTAVVSMFAGVDVTTLVHEVTGHYFSQTLINEGNKEGALERVVRGDNALLAAVSLDRGKWNEYQELTRQATRAEWKMTNAQLLAEGERSESRKAIHEALKCRGILYVFFSAALWFMLLQNKKLPYLMP